MTMNVADRPEIEFPPSGVTRVPFRRGRNHVLVEVADAAARRYNFFIDTGASLSVVTPRFVREAATSRVEGPELVAAFGAFGRIAGSPELRELRDLRVGDLRIRRAAAVMLELPDVEEKIGCAVHGILGYNLLSRTITRIDYPTDELALLDPDRPDVSEALGTPTHIVPFELHGCGLILAQGSVNGGPEMPFVVDVGSQFTILNRHAVRSTGIEFEPVDGEDPVGPGGRGAAVARGVAETLRFGELRFDRPEVHDLDCAVFQTLGLAARDAGLLGNDLLGRYRVAIDYRRAELRFWG